MLTSIRQQVKVVSVAISTIPSLDTNVLLRIILRDNAELFDAARALLEQHKSFAIADQAIVEIVFALGGHYEYARTEIAEVIVQLMNNQHLVLNRALFDKVLPLYTRHSGVSFTDCCLAVYAKLNKQTPLYTFDKKMARDLPHVELVQ